MKYEYFNSWSRSIMTANMFDSKEYLQSFLLNSKYKMKYDCVYFFNDTLPSNKSNKTKYCFEI